MPDPQKTEKQRMAEAIDKEETYTVHKQDHTGRGVPQGQYDTFEQAVEAARLGHSTTRPSQVAANIWYVSHKQPDATVKITYVPSSLPVRQHNRGER